MSRNSLRIEALIRPAAALFGGLLFVVLCAWRGLEDWLDAPLNLRQARVVELPQGGNLTHFLADLHHKNIVAHPQMLRYYARGAGVADRVRAGEYRIEPGTTARQLLGKLIAGDVVEYSLTLIEGTSVKQALALMREQPRLKLVVSDLGEQELLTGLGVKADRPSPEGLFFPDTYHYHLGMKDADILIAAYERMQTILSQEWDARDEGLPYRDSYEALVMASLVERETGLESERARIAGVFVRRLQTGMRLQTDPAVIYGLGQEFDGNLRRSDLQAPGPFNTYLNAGLPPTPIALPGRAAIHAALHPAPGDALYFVARGDGSHAFSATLEEHNRAVRKYQKSRAPGAREGKK